VKTPSEKAALALKLLVAVSMEAVLAPPMLALTLYRGRAPDWALAWQNALRQRALLWMYPHARPSHRPEQS
jgi:hypothetical protein